MKLVATPGDPLWVQIALHQYGGPNQLAWNYIETGDINANGQKATVEQIKMEIWSSIIHGSKGITYFIHGKSAISDFDHKALLRPENAAHLAGITSINQEISSLAPVINSETLTGVATVNPSNPNMLIDFMVKEHDNATYVFATGMRDQNSVADFSFSELGDATIDVLGENRQIQMVDGEFSDVYFGYDTHLYRINTTASPAVGDFNNDDFINGGDLTIWQMHYGMATGASHNSGDADTDGDVDGSDFLFWQTQFLDHLWPIEPSFCSRTHDHGPVDNWIDAMATKTKAIGDNAISFQRLLLIGLMPLCLITTAARAKEPTIVGPEPVILWSQAAPGAKGDDDSDHPSLRVYLPPQAKATGTGIVICPGGGYRILAIDHEGHQIAKWLNAHGITAFVLQVPTGAKILTSDSARRRTKGDPLCEGTCPAVQYLANETRDIRSFCRRASRVDRSNSF